MRKKLREKRNQFNFNVVLDQKDRDTFLTLKNVYAINVSGAFKIFIHQLKDQLEKANVNFNLQTKT